MMKLFARRTSALAAFLMSMTLSAATSAAAISVNSLLDDFFVNASGQIFPMRPTRLQSYWRVLNAPCAWP